MINKEQIIKEIHPDRLYFIGFYLLGILFIVVSLFFYPYLVFLGIVVILLAEVVRIVETFFIFEGGIAREYKFLSTSREYTEFEKIQNLRVEQSFLENIFGIGSVHIDTAGSDKTEVNFHGIRDPYLIEKIIRGKM